MKLFGRLLVSVGSMLLGYYLITVTLDTHPFLVGIVIGIALFAIGGIIRDKY